MSTQRTTGPVALVAAARGGDPEAQDALVSACLPLVYNIVGRALNGSVDVDDVVQETMLRTLDGLERLRTPESFRSWLVAIAMNEIRRHWQDRSLAPGTVEEAEELADPGGRLRGPDHGAAAAVGPAPGDGPRHALAGAGRPGPAVPVVAGVRG